MRTLDSVRDDSTGVSNKQNCTLLQHNNNKLSICIYLRGPPFAREC